MSVKYKIEDAKKNKNLINDEIKLSKIKSKGDHGDSRRKPLKSKAPTWFKEFNDNINKRFDKQEELNKTLINRIDNIVKVNNLKE